MITALQQRYLKGLQLEPSTYDAITTRKLVRHLKRSTGNQPGALESALTLGAQAKVAKPQFPFFRMYVSALMIIIKLLIACDSMMSWSTPCGPFDWSQKSVPSEIIHFHRNFWPTKRSPSGSPTPEAAQFLEIPGALISALQERSSADRARRLLSGDLGGLLESMSRSQKQ
jgi:hypothetical protein